MPINRTPPASPQLPPIRSVAATDESLDMPVRFALHETSLHQSISAPDLSPESNVTERNKKRKFEGVDTIASEELTRAMFATYSKKQENQYEDMMFKINSIIEQNIELKRSVEVMSDKYDEFLNRISALEAEKKEDKRLIRQLEDKIEHLERTSRATGIEIRNVPKIDSETKDDLCELVANLGRSLNLEISHSDLRDVHRLKTKENSSPILVNFNSVILKDKVIKGVKNFNKTKEKLEKLNTTHLKLKHSKQPVYISECLTNKTQKLFYLARTQHKDCGYDFCWTSHGVVYLRRKVGDPQIRVNSETDFEKLKCANSA